MIEWNSQFDTCHNPGIMDSMHRPFVRFLFARRALLKRLIWIRRPVLIRLKEFAIYVELTDWVIGARIAVRHTYEPHVSSVLRRSLQPGMVVVDIGANIGYYTLLAASRVGRSGKVIAFEPSAHNCALLQKSVEANGFHSVQVYPFAVAEAEGIVGFEMDDSNGSISRGDPTSCSQQVRAVALDTFLKDEPCVDVVKIDIEGAEGRALAGMRGLIEKHHPLVFSEFSPGALQANSGISPEVYLDQLMHLGYDLFVLSGDEHGGTPQSIAQIMDRCRLFREYEHVDLMAVPNAVGSH